MLAGQALLADHVARFNAGVRSGDFGPMVDGFTEDGELVFEGIPVGPFRGREAIASAYRTQAPRRPGACGSKSPVGDQALGVEVGRLERWPDRLGGSPGRGSVAL